MQNKKVLIIGAGITGRTLAALLESRGVVPTIVDKARKNDSNGVGISIMPVGLRVLETLGLRPQLEQAGSVLQGVRLYDVHGNQLNSFGLAEAGVESITLDRGSLLDILGTQLKHTKIRWRTSVSKLKQVGDSMAVTFTDGARDTFDLVVGADGINSLVRSKILPAAKPEKVGAAIWMLKPAKCTIKDNRFAHLTFGRHRFMAIFPYRKTASIALAMPLADDIDPRTIDVGKAFGGMPELSPDMLRPLSKRSLYTGHLRQLKLKTWYQGRIVLAGDSAHAMLPATGMGASNGIQDAAVLARLITEMPLELWDLLPKQYQKLQKPIIDARQREAYLLGRVMLLNQPSSKLRNTVFSLLPRPFLGKAVVRH